MSTKKIQIIGSPYVAYNEQTLTDEQKAQVRENIGAVSENNLANYETYITLQMYGAVGDGVADDTEAVKAAIAAAKEQNKPIFVAEGTYNLADIIDFDNIEIVGASPEKCVFKMVAQATEREHFIVCNNSIVVKNIQFKQSHNGSIFGMFGCNNSVIENCYFIVDEGMTNNGYFDMYVNNNNIRIINCKFLNYSKQDMGGAWVRNVNDTVSKNIVFENCQFEHATKDEAIAVWGWNGTVEDVTFQNCSFEDVDNEIYPVHFITLGMSGISRNLTMDNCRIYHNNAASATIKSQCDPEASIVENVNINNCYFNINGASDKTTYQSFYSNEIGCLKVNNCTIESSGKILFNNTIVNNCNIVANAMLADYSIIKNSILTMNGGWITQTSIEFYNCVLDFGNKTFSNIMIQPLVANSKVVINTCEFKGINGFTSGNWFFLCSATGVSLEIINSKIGNCQIWSDADGFQATIFDNVLTSNAIYISNATTKIYNNIINGVHYTNGVWTPTDRYINNLIAAATELPTVTTSDSGKFLRVSADGTWVAETIPHIEEVAF